MGGTGKKKTYLLTWNPKNWPWDEQQVAIHKVVANGGAEDSWSIGNRTSMPIGSRFFLIRLGDSGRGIIGAGHTSGEPYKDTHWDKSRPGETANYVSITFDALHESPRISWDELHKGPFSTFPWGSRSSGIEIPGELSARLEKIWKTGSGTSIYAELSGTAKDYPEGAVRAVLVNAYERSDAARRACIAKHGATCQICRDDMGKKYGPVATGFIHVHHRLPLAKIGKSYKVNPAVDLVPLCPSCHAVVHLKDPPLSIEQVQKMIRQQKDKNERDRIE